MHTAEEPKSQAVKSRSHSRALGQKHTSISLDEEILEVGKRMAEADGRSFSNFLQRLVIEQARKTGLLKKKD